MGAPSAGILDGWMITGVTARRTDRLTALGVRLLRTRWLVRAPIWLYRARIGAVLGSRLLMLEHTGRTSGRRRFAVLEVVGRPCAGTWVVVSGFGVRSQWFRNVEAEPRVRVQVGSRRPVPALARRLGPEAAAATLARYAHAHPRAWDHLRPVIEAAIGGSIEERSSELPMMALEAAADRTHCCRTHRR